MAQKGIGSELVRDTTVEPRSIDSRRPMRVVVIGAGISGILASIRFPQKIPNLELQIYEKNDDIGGTWYENRYPGVACDIPSVAYQATFEPNLDWSQFYASSSEIHRYWKKVVAKYGSMRYIKLKQKVIEARWLEETSRWNLKIEDISTGSSYTDSCNVLISATGALNDWRWPQIPNLHDFEGKLLHSASWDQSYDWTDKRVAVVGNGSSGIQIVPAMLPRAAHIDHYIRGRTWLSPTFAREKLDQIGDGLDNFTFSEKDILSFKNDPGVYQRFRKDIELELQTVHNVTMKGSAEQLGAIEQFTKNMERRLARKPELIAQLMPSFAPACRRLTPGPGYLEALTDPKVDLITNPILRVDKTGIITEDGQHHAVDAIACATGFNTSFRPRFPVIGQEGISLAEKWKDVPETYLAVSTDKFPNYFVSLGPNAALGTGNLLILVEKELEYFAMCVEKMQRENISSMVPSRRSVERFTKYCDKYFENTVFSTKCRSWYKGGTEDGRVSALWPGSSLHAMQVFSIPRWEDFEYEYVNDNAWGWFGDGWTEDERHKRVKVDYLDPENIDFPVPVDPISTTTAEEDSASEPESTRAGTPDVQHPTAQDTKTMEAMTVEIVANQIV